MRYYPPLKERFWAKVYKRDGENACWTWCGSISTTSGYGTMEVAKKRKGAHVVSWFLEHGVWPTKYVLHTCDEPRCVRPSHLFVGTQKKNAQDMVEKGRAPSGWFAAKLSPGDAEYIRSMSGKVEQKILAEKFGVSQTLISRIQLGKTHRQQERSA